MKKAFTLIELLIVVAIIAILAAIAVPNFLEAQTRAKVARVLSDQRTYATALETYMIDNSTYFPYWGNDMKGVKPPGASNINVELAKAANNTTAEADWKKLTTFAYKIGSGSGANYVPPLSLTSPVSYLSTYVPDTFASLKQATFGYASGPAFILWSPGPDQVDSLGREQSAELIANAGQSLPSPYLVVGPGGTGANKPTQTPFTGASGGDAFTYDASNGTASTGDVYRTK